MCKVVVGVAGLVLDGALLVVNVVVLLKIEASALVRGSFSSNLVALMVCRS